MINRRCVSPARTLLATLVLVAAASAQQLSPPETAEADAESLQARAEQLFSTGRYEEALPLAERVLALREQTQGEQHLDTARALNTLGRLHYVTGAYARAEIAWQRALAIRESLLGPEHVDTAAVLSNVAVACRARGNCPTAEPQLLRVLAIRERVLGPGDPKTAETLQTLGTLYMERGEHARAESTMQRALRIFEAARGPNHPEVARLLVNLGNLYRTIADYASAAPVYQRAIEILEKAQGPDHPETASALNNLAILRSDAGAYVEAERLFQRVLASREKTFGRDALAVAPILNNLASAYIQTGAYDRALPMLQRALQIKEAALGREHLELASTLHNLGDVYSLTGAIPQALQMLQRCLAIRERVLGPDHPDTANALTAVATLHAMSGDPVRAQQLLQRALAIQASTQWSAHPDAARTLITAGDLNLVTNDHTAAEEQYRRALKIREQLLGGEHPLTGATLSRLAALAWARERPDQALPLLQRTQRIAAKNANRVLLAGSEARKHAFLQALANDTFRDVSFARANPSSASTALALSSVLQYKGRALDVMAEDLAQVRRSVQPKDRALIAQLAEVATQLSTLTYRGPGEATLQRYGQRLNALTRRQEDLETELAKRSNTFRQRTATVQLDAVARAIPADAVLIEWLRYRPFTPQAVFETQPAEPRYVAFVLQRRTDTAPVDPVLIDLGAARDIEALVLELRGALSDPERSDVKQVAALLSGKLFQPLQPYLGRQRHLLLSPDGALNLVPMAALLDQRGNYLLQRWEISYLTSGRDLLRMNAAAGPRSRAVVVANPTFDERSSMLALRTDGSADAMPAAARSAELDRGEALQFRALRSTALEASALQGLLGLDARHVLQQDDATEARVKQLHGPRILHIATHGFFLNDQDTLERTPRADTLQAPIGENPLLRSGLALAGANARRSGKEDGILTAAEVARLDLTGTQLVVLSACESGVGEVHNGEGVFGLRRALMLAGAQSQVTTLWSVADRTTSSLMIDYYKRLLQGGGRSAALRAAQLRLANTAAHQHPYYWAAFLPIGNWTPLPAQ